MEQTVTATGRDKAGSAASRRMRGAGQVPGVVYGSGKPRLISLDHDSLHRNLSHEAFHSSVLNLEVDGKKFSVLLRDVQSHPVNDRILHVDFQSIASDTKVGMTVPIHYINAENSPGVKLNHGVFSVIEANLEIHCLPRDLPENIEVDVGHLEINNNIHLSEIQAPAGVTFDALARGEDPSIATILPPQKEEEVVQEAAEEEVPETDEQSETDTERQAPPEAA